MKRLTLSAYISPLRSDSCDMDLAPWMREMYPEPVTKNRPSWFKTLKRAHSETGHSSVRMCPSFINLMKEGFVLKNQADIKVTREQDKVHIHSTLVDFDQHIDTHSIDQFGEDYPFPEGFLKMSVKFVSPFMFRPNRSVSLFILPCWWTPEFKYVQAMHGLVQMPSKFDFNTHINTFVKSPEEDEIVQIPAGTPLAHLFFVDMLQVNVEYEQHLANTRQAKQSMMEPEYRRTRRMVDKPIDRIKKFLLGR